MLVRNQIHAWSLTANPRCQRLGLALAKGDAPLPQACPLGRQGEKQCYGRQRHLAALVLLLEQIRKPCVIKTLPRCRAKTQAGHCTLLSFVIERTLRKNGII